MFLIVDTNILMDFPYIMYEAKDVVILTDILRELDGLKLNSNPEVAFKARRAAVLISKNLKNLRFDNTMEDIKKSVDDKLIDYCLKDPSQCILITNDVYLKIKALVNNIITRGYGSSNDDYTGLYYLRLPLDENLYNEELEKICSTNKFSKLGENEYLIISNTNVKNTEDAIVGIYVNKNGVLQQVIPREIRNKWINKIYPRNAEQKCLFDALQRKENTIIYAGGSFGTGKSFILNNYAISELEKGNIQKIVYVPNNSYTENTLDIGALPGELLEKVTGQIGPLVDLVGIDEVHSMIQKEQLEVVPMSSIRGRSFQNSIIIINEAQNLTEDHIKLLIARCGENTRIFFDGDYKQADSEIFRNKNGLKLLLNLRKSPLYSKIFATVRLSTIERSFTAQASNYLDTLTGGI